VLVDALAVGVHPPADSYPLDTLTDRDHSSGRLLARAERARRQVLVGPLDDEDVGKLILTAPTGW
jgi:hypothetical protein